MLDQEARQELVWHKLHANVDARYKLIRKLKVSAANVDDGQSMADVLDPSNTRGRLLADRGYDDSGANRGLLETQHLKDGIARRTQVGKGPGAKLKARNRAINRSRARVEHVFAGLHQFGGKPVRALTLARNTLAITLKCVIYNLKRLVWRAIADMAMAQHLRQPVRLYSLSRQLQSSRSAYYDALNQAQRGDTDVTRWVQWFARQCAAACHAASKTIDQEIEKRQFWERHAGSGLHDRQRKVLQRLLDDGDGGFLGGLNAGRYMKMTGVSKATATRDLSEMVAGGQLWSHGVGKAVRYYVNVPGWSHGVGTDGPGPAAGLADAEYESEQSEMKVRAALDADGYTVSEKSGEKDHQYFAPVVAVSSLHVAKDAGPG